MKNTSEKAAEMKTTPLVETHTPEATSPAPTTAKVTTGNTLTDLGITESGKANGKPRYLVNSKAVIQTKSGFKKKLLCYGATFTAGHACGFSCTFCYVESMIFSKNDRLKAIAKEKGLKFEDMVVDITDAPTKVRQFLTKKNGKPKFTDPTDQRVIYASPLVDVAANMGQVGVTVEICKAILELTHWHIRLLSKSPLLLEVAKQIPEQYKNRVIYGLSTGTFDSELAALFEKGTGLVSKRLAALKWLQDNGYRTFGMICPILPQTDYKAFAKSIAEHIDITKCEHVWAEVINGRGDALPATVKALRDGNRDTEADLLAAIIDDKKAWETSAQKTFEALAEVIPAEKLRFLQYVNAGNLAWWNARKNQGAVLLAKVRKAKKTKKATK